MVFVYNGDEDGDYDNSCGDDFDDDYHVDEDDGFMIPVYNGDEDGDGDYDSSFGDDFDGDYVMLLV